MDAAGPCRQCRENVGFPDVGTGELRACYACLRAGKAAISKDTELGMIDWAQAVEGVTHGVPGLARTDFEMVPRGGDWNGARLPTADMFELVRTPLYESIQGERWLFCCGRPMTFVGQWARDEFSRRSPNGDGKEYFERIVRQAVPGLWEDELHDVTGIYVFRCRTCGGHSANWDLA